MALKGSGNKGSGGGKSGINTRQERYRDDQRKKSKAKDETLKPQRKN